MHTYRYMCQDAIVHGCWNVLIVLSLSLCVSISLRLPLSLSLFLFLFLSIPLPLYLSVNLILTRNRFGAALQIFWPHMFIWHAERWRAMRMFMPECHCCCFAAVGCVWGWYESKSFRSDRMSQKSRKLKRMNQKSRMTQHLRRTGVSFLIGLIISRQSLASCT